MNRHTAGPWKAVELNPRVGFAEFEIQYENDGECIAEGVYRKDDAVLIAAAPDMLEALENLENNGVEIPDHAWIMIKNAIDKATGKSLPTGP